MAKLFKIKQQTWRLNGTHFTFATQCEEPLRLFTQYLDVLLNIHRKRVIWFHFFCCFQNSNHILTTCKWVFCYRCKQKMWCDVFIWIFTLFNSFVWDLICVKAAYEGVLNLCELTTLVLGFVSFAMNLTNISNSNGCDAILNGVYFNSKAGASL